MTEIIIVDANDDIIGYKERSQIKERDIYRVSALWIENPKGDILLAQRALNKKNDPGKWGPAVAGTNDKGETYEENIIHEAEEEIGLKGYEFEKKEKIRRLGKHNFFCQWFRLVIDKPIEFFTKQDEEVEEIRWFSRDELREAVEKDPDNFLRSINDFILSNR